MKPLENYRSSDDFRGKRSSVIRLVLLNIRSEIGDHILNGGGNPYRFFKHATEHHTQQ